MTMDAIAGFTAETLARFFDAEAFDEGAYPDEAIWPEGDPAHTQYRPFRDERRARRREKALASGAELAEFLATPVQERDTLVAAAAVDDALRFLRQTPAVTLAGQGGAYDRLRNRPTGTGPLDVPSGTQALFESLNEQRRAARDERDKSDAKLSVIRELVAALDTETSEGQNAWVAEQLTSILDGTTPQ